MATITKSIDESIFDFIYNMAVVDALRRTNYDGDIKYVAGNKQIKNCVFYYLKYIIESGSNTQDVFIKTVKTIQRINENDWQKKNHFKFGNIQKLLNMVVKYYYINCFDDTDKKTKFAKCHAPMDNTMKGFVYDSYSHIFGKRPNFRRNYPWGNLENDNPDYDGYQKAIEDIINKKNLGINRIEFDYIYWNYAKDEYAKSKEEREKIIERVWG